MSELELRCETAPAILEKHLATGLPHPEGLLRLVQFSHDSPGLRIYKRRIAEALCGVLESSGHLLFASTEDAVTHLKASGYTVTKRKPKRAAGAPTEPV